MKKKQKVLIVDGHSLIFQWKEMAVLHARNGAGAREEVVRQLRSLQDSSDWTVVVVFDGKGARASDASEPSSIFVFYSAAGQTADTIIERLVAKYAEHYDVTVASDDHLERTTVQTFGASAMSIIQLRGEMERTAQDLDTLLKRLSSI